MRKVWIWGGAGAGAIGLAAYWYAHRVERERVSLHRATVAVDKRGLPRAGLTILHLSDFHFRAHDPVQEARLERLRSLLAVERYDVLALTGDLIHNEAGLPEALAFLAELHPEVAAFWVPGNRDYWESSFRALFGTPEERQGLTAVGKLRLLLRKTTHTVGMFAGNERATLRLHRNDVDAMKSALQAQRIESLINHAINLRGPRYDVWFAGVDDLTQGRPNIVQALAGVPPDAPVVLLAHNPDIWFGPTVAERVVPVAPGPVAPGPVAPGPLSRRADLILSGHTHGGQINLPVIGAWYRQGTRVGRHQPAGWFIDGSSRMFVSRGLGESFPFRFGAPPEAALIRLVPKGGGAEPIDSRRRVGEE